MGVGLAHAFVLVAVFAVAVAVRISRPLHFYLSCAMYMHMHAIGRRNCKHTGGEAGTVRSLERLGGGGNSPPWGIIHVLWVAAKQIAVTTLAVLVVFFVLALFILDVWPFDLRVCSSGAVGFASRGSRFRGHGVFLSASWPGAR